MRRRVYADIFLRGEHNLLMTSTFSRFNEGAFYAAPPRFSLLPGPTEAGRVRGLPLPPLMVPAQFRS
jgi:hypothetical protein